MYDTVIIGKGPAGISAAIYLKRAGLNVLVIGKDTGSLEKAELIENYYGFSKPIKGKKLFNDGIKQALMLEIPVISDEVVEIEYDKEFTVKSLSASYAAKTLLIAAGRKRKTINLQGIEKYSGSGVSYCSVCDGFFYKNKNVAVIGSGNYALSEARYLKNFVKEIKIFTGGEQKTFEGNIEFPVIEDKIEKIYGNEKVEGIKTADKEYPADGIFIAMGSAGANDFAGKLGILTENGNIVVDKDFCTNIPGLYAAGDCIGGFLQVSKSVSDGANVANAITKYIRKINSDI